MSLVGLPIYAFICDKVQCLLALMTESTILITIYDCHSLQNPVSTMFRDDTKTKGKDLRNFLVNVMVTKRCAHNQPGLCGNNKGPRGGHQQKKTQSFTNIFQAKWAK